MATIDERVVSLKFNNSQFEQGIKQSSESLKKFSSFPGLDGLRSGFEKIKGLFSGFSLSGMSSQVEQMIRQYLDARDGTQVQTGWDRGADGTIAAGVSSALNLKV